MSIIPSKGLKQRGPGSAERTWRVQMSIIPSKGLKRLMSWVRPPSWTRPNEHHPEQGIETGPGISPTRERPRGPNEHHPEQGIEASRVFLADWPRMSGPNEHHPEQGIETGARHRKDGSGCSRSK